MSEAGAQWSVAEGHARKYEMVKERRRRGGSVAAAAKNDSNRRRKGEKVQTMRKQLTKTAATSGTEEQRSPTAIAINTTHGPPFLPPPPPVLPPHCRRGPGVADADGDRGQGWRGPRAGVPGEPVARPGANVPHGGGNPSPAAAAEPAGVAAGQGRLLLVGHDRAPPQGWLIGRVGRAGGKKYVTGRRSCFSCSGLVSLVSSSRPSACVVDVAIVCSHPSPVLRLYLFHELLLPSSPAALLLLVLLPPLPPPPPPPRPKSHDTTGIVIAARAGFR